MTNEDLKRSIDEMFFRMDMRLTEIRRRLEAIEVKMNDAGH